MFGRKSKQIEFLKADLSAVRDRRDVYYEKWQSLEEQFARKESELEILQEAFRNGVKITEELKENIAGYEYELAEARLQNENLRKEAEESSRMFELYRALVASLRIGIKLPAKKTRG